MKNAWEAYGAALLGGQLRAVRIEHDGARLLVTSFLTSADNPSGDTLENGRLIFNVDESQAVIKRITVSKNSHIDPERIARFELMQGLLGNPSQYYFDIIPAGETSERHAFFTIAYHKYPVDEQMVQFERRLRKPSGFRLNGIALAAGYRAFCRQLPGDIQLLCDVENDTAILVVLYKKAVYAICRLETVPGENPAEKTAQRLAREMKMTISYQLARCFQDGITVPPSRLILCGGLARNEILMEEIAGSVSMPVTLPEFNAGYFAGARVNGHRLEEFLIPLGLAVA